MTGGEGKYTWIGQAISENFQAELAKAGFALVNPVNPDGPVAIGDPDRAMRVAQNSKAEVVIFGSYQFIDPDLRVTGQVLDVPSNQIVGVLKASGTFRQLFTIEDDLSDQAKKLLIGENAGKEVLEPRPPLAPGKEPYDTNTTAADDTGREYKLPYRDEPVAYEDDYLGVGYTNYYYPYYYRPRVYSFIGYSNYDYYYPYASCYPYFFPSYCYYSPWRHCYYPRSYFGSGLFFSFSYSNWGGWGGHHWNNWNGHHWNGNWSGHDSRGPRFGDRPRSIMLARDGPAGHDFFHGTQNYYVSRQRQTIANRVINIDRDRSTITDRNTGRTEFTNHTGAQLVDSPRRYTRASDNDTVVRRSDRTVEIRNPRRADSDTRVATSDRVWDRSNPDGPRSRDTVRSDSSRTAREEPVRVRETPRESPRETPRDSARSRDSGPSGDGNRFREPTRFQPPPASRAPERSSGGGGGSVRDSSPRGDSGSRGGGGSVSSRGDSGGSRSGGGGSFRSDSGGGSSRGGGGGGRGR
jgi:hypothetical protein